MLKFVWYKLKKLNMLEKLIEYMWFMKVLVQMVFRNAIFIKNIKNFEFTSYVTPLGEGRDNNL